MACVKDRCRSLGILTCLVILCCGEPEIACNENCTMCTEPWMCVKCKVNRYGTNCDKPCASCWNTGCDVTTGRCTTCIPGYYTETCDVPCPAHCRASVTGSVHCDRDTGECWDGCVTSSWGKMCNDTCSSNCADYLCSQEDGRCLACVSGWHGQWCENKADTRYLSVKSPSTDLRGEADKLSSLHCTILTAMAIALTCIFISINATVVCVAKRRRGLSAKRLKVMSAVCTVVCIVCMTGLAIVFILLCPHFTIKLIITIVCCAISVMVAVGCLVYICVRQKQRRSKRESQGSPIVINVSDRMKGTHQPLLEQETRQRAQNNQEFLTREDEFTNHPVMKHFDDSYPIDLDDENDPANKEEIKANMFRFLDVVKEVESRKDPGEGKPC